MSRKPRTPGAGGGGPLSWPRRGAPVRSRVGGGGSWGGSCGGCDRDGGASARGLRCERGSCLSCPCRSCPCRSGRSSCPSGGRSLRCCGGDGGRGRCGDGCDAEGGGAASPGLGLGRVAARR